MILNVTIDAKNFVLINFYNPYTENQEVEVLNTLVTMMKTTDMKKNSNFLLAGDFNVLYKFKFLIMSYNETFLIMSQSLFQRKIRYKIDWKNRDF